MAGILTWKATLVIIIIVFTYGSIMVSVGYSCGCRTAEEEERKKELRKKGIIK